MTKSKVEPKKKDCLREFLKPTKLKIATFLTLYALLLFASYYRIMDYLYINMSFPNPIYVLEPFIVLSKLSLSMAQGGHNPGWNSVMLWNSFISALIGILNMLYHYLISCLIVSVVARLRRK